MKYCEKCMMNINSSRKSCPLCQAPISGEPEREPFPYIPTIYKQFSLFFKILILSTFSVSVLSVAINIMIPQSGYWSLFVVGGIACFWISSLVAIRKRNNIPKNISYQTAVISIISIFWDFSNGWHGWSVDFVVPAICIIAMASLGIIAKVKKIPTGDYLACLLADCLFGIVPGIFLLFGIVKIIYPSIISIVISIISLASLLIFEGKSMKQELDRRFHL